MRRTKSRPTMHSMNRLGSVAFLKYCERTSVSQPQRGRREVYILPGDCVVKFKDKIFKMKRPGDETERALVKFGDSIIHNKGTNYDGGN